MRYRLTTEHHIDDRLLPEGTILENFEGIPSMFMEPLDDEAQAAYAARMAKLTKPVPVEAMRAPQNIPPGMRVGGLGPADEKAKNVTLPGQGPRTQDGRVPGVNTPPQRVDAALFGDKKVVKAGGPNA